MVVPCGIRTLSPPSVCASTVAAWELVLAVGVTSGARIPVWGSAAEQRLAALGERGLLGASQPQARTWFCLSAFP